MVEVGFHVGQKLQQSPPQRPRPLGKAPLQLAGGAAVRPESSGANEMADRFRLRQIHFTVEKSPQREFSGLGEPGATGLTQLQKAAQDIGRTVAGNFDGVLARVAAGSAKKDGQGLIQENFAVEDARRQDFAGLGPQLRGRNAGRFQKAKGDRPSAGAAESHHAQGALAGGGGRRDNRLSLSVAKGRHPAGSAPLGLGPEGHLSKHALSF